MDGEPLILVMAERMALPASRRTRLRLTSNMLRLLQTMSDYTSLKKIAVSEIEGFINRMVTDNKISVSYQHSLVGR